MKLGVELPGDTVVLGVGNPLRGDDGVGSYIARALSERGLRAFDCETVPENWIGKVASLRPSTVLIIDALVGGGEPGSLTVLDREQIPYEVSSTHSLSLSLFVEHLTARLNTRVILVGIEPLSTRFGEGLSQPVRTTAEEIITELVERFGK